MSIDTPCIDQQKLWDHVLVGDGCWEWQRKSLTEGYGVLTAQPFRAKLAHRLAYEFLVGPIPEGLQIDHLCRNRKCCNPSHLEAVTRRENILRGTAPSALQARQTHCKRGHEFTEANTYLKSGYRTVMRICRTCHRDRVRMAARRQRSA